MVNPFAVLSAAIAAMVLGALWYSVLFGNAWMRLMKLKPKDIEKNEAKKSYILGFLNQVVIAFALATLMVYTEFEHVAGGLLVAFLVWLGFVATFSFSSVLWEGRPVQLWLLNNAYNLLSLLLMGAILGAWM